MSPYFIRMAQACLFGLFCLPFLYPRHTPPFPSFYNEWLAALFALGLLALLVAKPVAARLELPRIALFPLGMLLVLSAQFALGDSAYPSQVFVALVYVASALLLMLAVRTLAQTTNPEALLTLLAWATLIGGLANALAGVLQYWELRSFLDPLIVAKVTPAAYGNLAQANHFANHMALAVTALLYLSAQRKLPLWLAAGFGLALLLGLSLSGSRTAWLYLAALFALAVLFRMRSDTTAARLFILSTVASLLAFLLMQLALPHMAPKAVVAMERLASQDLLNVRWDLWSSALRIFAENPWSGAGYHRFAWSHFLQHAEAGQALHDPVLSPDFVHNLPLQLLAEFGLAGGLIAGFVGYWLYAQYRRIDSAERWLLMGMITVLVIHSLLEYPLNYMYFLAPAAVLLALSDDRPITLAVPVNLSRLFMVVMLILGLSLLSIEFVSYQALENAYLRIGKTGRIDSSQDAQLLMQARQFGPFFEPEVDNIFNALRIEAKRPDKWKTLLAVSTRSIGHKMTASRLYRHILLLALNEDAESASRYLDMATKVYPSYRGHFEIQLARLRQELPEHKGLLHLQVKGLGLP